MGKWIYSINKRVLISLYKSNMVLCAEDKKIIYVIHWKNGKWVHLEVGTSFICSKREARTWAKRKEKLSVVIDEVAEGI